MGHAKLWPMIAGMALAACGQEGVEPPDAGNQRDAGYATDGGPGVDGGSTDAGRLDGGSIVVTADPDEAGPFTVESSESAIDGATVVAFVPNVPLGTRAPLVVVKHGFQLATSNYATLCERVASHGFVVIGVDTGGSAFDPPTNAEERDATIAAIDYAIGEAAFSASVDPDRVAVAGHSRGGKIAVMIAAADARVDAALLLDPVNGCGPGADYSASCPDITSSEIAGALTIPVGVMGETNNATGGFMPCAPADQNYQTIFAALTSSSWATEWTFTGADHMDFTDDGGGFAGSFCADGPGDDAQIREAVRAMSVAFVRLHLRGDDAMTAWLAGASLPAGIERVGP